MDVRADARGTAGRGARRERVRTRTCVGCGERVPLEAQPLALIRLIFGPGGVVAVDPGNGGFGRGAHVHARPDCLSRAAQRGLARAAKGQVNILAGAASERLTAASLADAIRQAMHRRTRGLILSAVRSRGVAIGASAAAEALDRGAAALVVVACDAAAGADLPQVQRAIAEGRAVAWGTKEELGALSGGRREQGVAVMAITSARIASAIAEAVRIGDICTPRPRGASNTGNVERGA
jgi:predicted RNA-binding protein YlxR (DUF448 family)